MSQYVIAFGCNREIQVFIGISEDFGLVLSDEECGRGTSPLDVSSISWVFIDSVIITEFRPFGSLSRNKFRRRKLGWES